MEKRRLGHAYFCDVQFYFLTTWDFVTGKKQTYIYSLGMIALISTEKEKRKLRPDARVLKMNCLRVTPEIKFVK